MKKFTKGCIITAVILIFLGIIVLAAAIGTGGISEISRMARNGELGVIGYNSYDLDYLDDYFGDNDYGNELFEGELEEVSAENLMEMEGVRELNIDFTAGGLYIKTTDSDYIKVETNRKNVLRYYMDGDRLVLRDRNNQSGSRLKNRKLYVYIPEDADLEMIKVDLGAGQAVIDPVAVRNIKVEVGAGRARLAGLQAEEASFEVGAGEIEVDQADVGTVDIQVDVGRAVFKGSVTEDMDAECNMGTLDIWLDGEEEDYNFEMDTDIGNVVFNGKEGGGGIYSRGDGKIDNGASSDIKLKTSMGKVNVYFND